MQPAKPERSEVYLPLSVINLLEAEMLTAKNMADVDPGGVPSNAAVETDESPLVVRRILNRRQASGELARRRGVERAMSFLLERFMRSLVVVFMTEGVEATLLA